MLIALILLTLVLSAFFSGSEIAFVTANRLRAEVRAQREGQIGHIVREFLHDPPRFLTTTLVGNNVALVAYSTLMGLLLERPLSLFFERSLGTESVGGWVLLVQTLIASALVLVFGEIIPKSLLRNPSGNVVVALALPLKLTYWLLLPIIKLAGWASAALVRLVGVPAASVGTFLHRDFAIVVRESRESGTLDLDEEESEILTNVFELRTLRVKDSMVPRTEIQAVEESADLAEVRTRFVESGHSRLPVYREHIDQITGVVLAHDLFHAPATLADIVRPVQVVPESKPARDLLFAFLQSRVTLAVVVDEYGGTAGIVTVEDLLEELFGDIRDEHDPDDVPIRRIDERNVLVSGRVELGALEEHLGIHLPEGDYDTVGGLLSEHLGTIPDERETLDIEGYHLTVIKASANRVETVRITTV